MEIELRNWNPTDVEVLITYGNNKAIADWLTDRFPHPYTEEHAIAFIEKANAETPKKLFAITLGKSVVGSIGIFPDTDVYKYNAQLGYWLAQPFWGRGIMPKAIQLITNYGFETFHLKKVYAKVFGGNQKSMRTLKKSGFSLEAVNKQHVYKNGVFLDEYVYVLIK